MRSDLNRFVAHLDARNTRDLYFLDFELRYIVFANFFFHLLFLCASQCDSNRIFGHCYLVLRRLSGGLS